MAFREYLRSRIWVVPLLLTMAFIATDTVIHLRATYRISEQHLSPGPMPAGDSPTGYAMGQRDIILPYTGMDGYHWIMQTQDMLAKGEERVRWVDYDNYDNGPKGREVQWSSSLHWWVAFLAWVEHVYGGVPMPIAVEHVMPFANTLLITLLLIPIAPFAARRFGQGPAALMLLGMGAILPMYEAFSEGKSDHHGLAALSNMLTLLFLLGAGAGWVRTGSATGELSPFLAWLPDRAQAKRWFIASGIVGGIGLWVSTASEAPVLAEAGLAALVATGWLGYGAKPEDGARPDPSLWRVWGWAGAATSVFFYFAEYFPSHFGMRLEVNHPLYAAAWAGGGEVIYRVCRWWNGGKLATNKSDWLWLSLSVLGVCTAPAVVYFFADKVFWIASWTENSRFLFIFHEDYIAEFKDMFRYLDPMYASASAKYLLAVLNPVALLAIPMVVWLWRQMRVPVLTTVALGTPAYGLLCLILHFLPSTQALYPLNHGALWFCAGLLAVLVAAICLLKPEWEKITLLATLAASLFAYDLFLLVFENYLSLHPKDWPLDYYFWPFLSVPITVTLALLALWEPWPDFPRPAKALILLCLPPTLITLALSIREMRWMEIDYALWLATLVGMVALLGRLRDYRWKLMPLALTIGLTTVALGELELRWVEMGNTPAAAILTVLAGALFVVLMTVVIGRLFRFGWQPLTRVSLLVMLPPIMLALLFWGGRLYSLAGTNWVPWLGAILAVAAALCLQRGQYDWKAMARTFVGAMFLGAVMLPSAVGTIMDWHLWMGPTPMSDVEIMEVVTRDVSQRLRAQLGNDTAVVVSGPTTTTWMIYWGGFKGLGTLYWENLEGLRADMDIYAAKTPEEALKLIKERGVTHIAIFSWDPFYKEYARLAHDMHRPYDPNEYAAEKPLRDWLDQLSPSSKPQMDEAEAEIPLLKNDFVYSLIEGFKVPPWLRMVYYPMPGDRQLRNAYVLIFEVVPPQSPEEAATRMAQFHMLRNDQVAVLNSINAALQANPNYLPALICAARFDKIRGRDDEFPVIMRKIRLLLPLADTLNLADRVDLATDFVLDGDDGEAKQQIAACLPLANARNLRRLTLDQQYNFLSFMRQTGLLEQRPGLRGFIFTLLPDAQRSQFLFDSGRTLENSDPAGALALFRRALNLQPDSVPLLAELAALLANTHVDALRNPKEALAFSVHARELDRGQSYDVTDALACAYAANGQFAPAVNLEQQAIRQAQIAEQQAAQQDQKTRALNLANAYRARLDLFQHQQPYRE